MNRKVIGAVAFLAGAALLAGCGNKTASWTVTCPWAPSGVAAMVNQKAAALSTNYSDRIVLVADAVKGDAATVNTWVAKTKADDTEMVFAGEGLFSITSILDPAKLKFTYNDFAFVENLYSSVFVLSADAKLGINNINELKAHLASVREASVAVNGAVGSEAFLAASLIGAMGYGEKLKLTPYTSAGEAAQAVARGEVDFAVSHQSQILETYRQGGVSIVCAFDGENIAEGVFKGVEGVGQYGYPYFRNRCFVLARQGTKQSTISELKKLFGDILADNEMKTWLTDTMMLEVDTMNENDVKSHIENVMNIVNEYHDIVVR